MGFSARGLCALTTLLGSLLFASAPLHAAPEAPTATDTIRIGQSLALNGPLAELGTELRDGAQAYLKWINSKGGIHGKKIELVSADDAYVPERAVQNVKKQLDNDKVLAFLGIMGTANYWAVMPLLDERKVPSVAPYTGSDDLRSQASPYTFWVRASYGDEAEKIVRQLTTTGVTRIAVFYQDDTLGISGVDGVTKALRKRNLTIAAKGSFDKNTLDVAPAVRTITAADPQAVIMFSTYKATAAFVRKLKQSGNAAQLFAVSVVGVKALSSELGADATGIAISQVMPYPWNAALPLVREFETIPKALQPAAGLTYTTLEGFISAKVLVEGLRRAGPQPTREKLTAALESLHNYDAGGYTLDFGPGKRQGSHFAEVTIVGSGGKLMR
ncbi:ABC transporter substrate-binding protein [Zoogloea sp. LCSB751]|uniref:ABC transporter substrate-binding protein n=1 Tax=Zoogloea sp. LCSB751 TaxID=1965277 RepID=UPI0009A4ECF4|nr:ABC transporter substrate-binding protein [Zoogloea sp. LCSB751]